MKALNPQSGNLEKIYVKAYDGNPVGTVMEYIGGIAPRYYLLLDGSTHNISSYPELAELIKTTFGSYNYFGGNGTTTFGLPDMRGRVPVGVDVRDVDFETIGKTLGSKSVVLTEENMPKNVELIKYSSASSNWGLQINNTEFQIKATGQGTPVNNIQPSMAWNFIIKATNNTPLNAHVVNAQSNSTTDTYSCKRVNDAIADAVKDVYSTTETKTNKIWIDNKPIYRKVVETNMTTSSLQKTYTLASIGLSNYSSIILLRTISQGNPINDDYFTTNDDQLRTLINQSGLIITVGSDYPQRPLTLYTIIEYTKTTD